MPDSSSLAAQLAHLVGPDHVITEEAAQTSYLQDWRGRYHGRARCIVLPGSTEEVAAVVALCARAGVPIVPQGGNTSLCGASVPDESGRAVVISLKRMNRIRTVDLDNDTLTAEAGVILAELQNAAAEAGRLFPLSLAAEGSCTLGGNLATNAGGTAVLRYGNMRELTLGLEVVLPDGRIWNGLRGLRKDNTGYDLKQLFIGAEGTLGIVTAAVVKLFPAPQSRSTGIVALPDPAAAVKLLRLLRARAGARLTTFELFARDPLALVLQHIPNSVDPLPSIHNWYALVELTDPGSGVALDDELLAAMEQGSEQGWVSDGAIAGSLAQRDAMWALREDMSEAQRLEGAGIKHDISLPVSAIPQFLIDAAQALHTALGEVRIVAFGHLGDGNLHYNLVQPRSLDKGAFTAQTEAANRVVHDLVSGLGGSISAEHGIGQLKRDELRHYKSALELELMAAVKRAIDPAGLMNPGKIV